MKQLRKNTTIFLLLFALLLCLLPVQATDDIAATDEELVEQFQIPDNWARPALLFAVRNGLLKGKANGLCPTDTITRAEVATVMMRIIGTETYTDLSEFNDVYPNAWYYDYLSRAVSVGIFSGCGDGTIRPNSTITRQEAVVGIARLIGVTGGMEEQLHDFRDDSMIATWATEAMMSMVCAGHIKGAAGYLYPTKPITRQEFAQILYSIFIDIDSIGDKVGTYALRSDGIAEGTTVNGNVILCGEAREVNLKNITITGRLVLQGCGDLNLQLSHCNIDTLVLCRPTTVSGDENEISRIVTLSDTAVKVNCTQLQIHANTSVYATAFSAAAVKGELTICNGGLIRFIYSGEIYRHAQQVTRVRIQGGTIKDTVLYGRFDENGTFSEPIRTLPKGTTFTYFNRYETSAHVRLQDGTEGYLRYSDIYVLNDKYYIDGEYADEVKECFVNYINDYQSNTEYLIWINRWTIKLTVFHGSRRQWTVDKTFPCAIGRNSSPTIEGERTVSNKQLLVETEEFYYHHVTFFGGAYAMHSRLYHYDGTFYDDTMSAVVSHGCVRLEDENAIYIYDTVPIKTKVVIY